MINLRGFVAAVLLAWCTVAAAQEHRHPLADVAAHERFYNTWMRPDYPESSCCNLKDCYATSFRREGDKWYALRREDAQWVHVPNIKFEQNRDSPDGRSHVCMTPPHEDGTSTVFCAVLGSGT